MLEAGATATLLITGTVGSGKTTVADHIGELLIKRGVPHAIVDLDQLRRSWPSAAGDRFNSALALQNLSCVATNYWSAGARRLVLAGVIEQRSEVLDHEAAVGCAVTVVRLRAQDGVIAERLRARHREDPEGLAWHLDRAPELDAILEQAAVADAEVDTTGRKPVELASDVLTAAGW
jgi:broad-specificity NMP kinase